jgi:hypothetical protein
MEVKLASLTVSQEHELRLYEKRILETRRYEIIRGQNSVMRSFMSCMLFVMLMMIVSMASDYVSELRSPTDLLFISQETY